MRMIRKQLYLGAEQQRKVRRLADRRGCTEAEIVRLAIDQLPDPEGTIESRLADAGLLVPPSAEDDLAVGAAAEELERTVMTEATAGEPIGLAQAVLEDRR